jgi:hypothetical protein
LPTAAAPWLLTRLDRGRQRALRALGPVARPYLRDRERRVVAVALLGLALSFALTGVAPMALLSLGPIVLGIPHLLADFRYLVFRPGWHRHTASVVAVGVPLLVSGWTSHPAWGMLAAVGAAAVAPGTGARRALGVAAASTLAAVAWRWPDPFRLVVAHGHNLVALALWASWRPGSRRRWSPLVAFGALYGAILLGALDGLVPRTAALAGWERTLAPGWPHPSRWVLAFAFAQSVHYAVWLRWIPEDDRAQFTPRSFSASWRAAIDDVGPALVAATVGGTMTLIGWAFVDVDASRDAYLRFAQFHGYLELAAIAGWGVGRFGRIHKRKGSSSRKG